MDERDDRGDRHLGFEPDRDEDHDTDDEDGKAENCLARDLFAPRGADLLNRDRGDRHAELLRERDLNLRHLVVARLAHERLGLHAQLVL